MEKVYRKVGRRYVSCGYNDIPDISDGIWMVQSSPSSKSIYSLFWRVGELNRPVDVVTQAAIQSISDDIASYLVKLGKDGKEYDEAKELVGGYLKGHPSFVNISAGDMASLILRRIALHLEEGEKLSWDTLQYKFREEVGVDNIDVKTLNWFTEWLEKNNVKFRQGKNIG